MNATHLSSAPVDLTGSLAYDTQAIARLRGEAAKDPKAALRQVAGQFEAMLVNEMLKTARAARLGGDDSGDSQGVYNAMFDEQMAQTLTKGHGFGLADLLAKQLESRYLPPSAATGQSSAAAVPRAPAATPAQ